MDHLLDAGQYVDVGTVRTHYLRAGSGAPIVLIHGGGAGADGFGNWRGVIERLSADFTVIAPDMPGFGRTDKPGNGFVYSQQARNAHLAGFLDALDLANPVLVGNSMGGATALGVAIEHPGRVRRLVLMGSAGLTTKIDAGLAPVMDYDFTRDGMVRLIRALTTDDFPIDDRFVAYRHALSIEPETRRAYVATMQWIRDQRGLFYDEDYIRRNRVPTLVVNGKNDKVVPLANAYRFLELIDQSWGYIIPHCGHWAMIEHPGDFTGVTAAFAQAN